MTSDIIKMLYSKIQKQLFYMIPEKWEKIYLYASIIEGINHLETGELFFYYYPKGILKRNPVNVYEVPTKFDLEEEGYLKLAEKLYDTLKELQREMKQQGKRIWTNVTIKVENFKFRVEFSYEDLLRSLYSGQERHLIWEYENLQIPLESFEKKEKNTILEYLEKTKNAKKDTYVYVEAMYRNPIKNVVEYNKDRPVYISQEEIEQIKPRQLGENYHYKNRQKSVKPYEVPAKKKQTYIEQIEEQKVRLKSQILNLEETSLTVPKKD